MFCPNCGNEIKEGIKFCTNCGFDLSHSPDKAYSFKHKNIIVVFLVVLILTVLSIIGIYAYNNFSSAAGKLQIDLPKCDAEIENYKTITPMWKKIDDLSPKEAIEILIQQEQDLKEFFSNNYTAADNSKLFKIFYENILLVSKKLDKVINSEENDVFWDDKKVTAFLEMQFTPYNVNLEKLTGYYKVTEPKTDLFRTVFAITNDNIEPDYSYIFNQFSKYLDKPYQEYLNHKMQYQITRKDGTLWDNGHRNKNITKDEIIKYILLLRNILNKYPEFELWEEVQSDIKIFVDAILFEDWKMENEPPIKKVLKDFLKVAQKDTYEYDTVKELYDTPTNEDEYETSWERIQEEWYDRTFYDDGTPIITQYEINEHSCKLQEILNKRFNEKAQEFKKLELNDNNKISKFINESNKRKIYWGKIVFPAKEEDKHIEYGSSYPIQYADFEENFNNNELYVYQKIVDTYLKKYEHVNKFKMNEYQNYYNKVKESILNSEYFANDMKKYIQDYESRKNHIRQIVSDKMNDNDYSVWFIQIELYSYKSLLLSLTHLADYKEEINKIFEFSN